MTQELGCKDGKCTAKFTGRMEDPHGLRWRLSTITLIVPVWCSRWQRSVACRSAAEVDLMEMAVECMQRRD